MESREQLIPASLTYKKRTDLFGSINQDKLRQLPFTTLTNQLQNLSTINNYKLTLQLAHDELIKIEKKIQHKVDLLKTEVDEFQQIQQRLLDIKNKHEKDIASLKIKIKSIEETLTQSNSAEANAQMKLKRHMLIIELLQAEIETQSCLMAFTNLEMKIEVSTIKSKKCVRWFTLASDIRHKIVTDKYRHHDFVSQVKAQLNQVIDELLIGEKLMNFNQLLEISTDDYTIRKKQWIGFFQKHTVIETIVINLQVKFENPTDIHASDLQTAILDAFKTLIESKTNKAQENTFASTEWYKLQSALNRYLVNQQQLVKAINTILLDFIKEQDNITIQQLVRKGEKNPYIINEVLFEKKIAVIQEQTFVLTLQMQATKEGLSSLEKAILYAKKERLQTQLTSLKKSKQMLIINDEKSETVSAEDSVTEKLKIESRVATLEVRADKLETLQMVTGGGGMTASILGLFAAYTFPVSPVSSTLIVSGLAARFCFTPFIGCVKDKFKNEANALVSENLKNDKRNPVKMV